MYFIDMSALKTDLPRMGVAITLLISGLFYTLCVGGTSTGPDDTLEILGNPTFSGPVLKGNTKGDLILISDEELHLSGSIEYRTAFLGDGSSLYLEDCDMNLTGDGNLIPSVHGTPDRFVMINSSLNLIGWDGSSLLRNQGANVTFTLNVGSEFRMINSTIILDGGNGWEPPSAGAELDMDIGGYQFSGGYCTFELNSTEVPDVDIMESHIELWGGDGGDAPDGEVMTLDDFFRSGGYTTGANVSGRVGTGGGTSIDLHLPGTLLDITDSSIFGIGGIGGDAGNGGGVQWNGDISYTHPTTSGGYTSGGWKNGSPYDPGTVSENVGCGGDSSFELLCMDLHIERGDMAGVGGDGGISGNGGSCISVTQGSPSSATNTRGGGGGAGYAGGYGGYAPLIRTDGGDGGDIKDRIASGGNNHVSINVSRSIWSKGMKIGGGGGWVYGMGVGGNGGGSFDLGIDGGGGGGAGYSGGGGAPAVSMFNDMSSGTNGTMVNTVASPGHTKVMIHAPFFMSSAYTTKIENTGSSITSGLTNGKHGEVGGTIEYAGGEGGRGVAYGFRESTRSFLSPRPGPFPLHPIDGTTITDLSEPFSWSGIDVGFFSPVGLSYSFRLLNSSDINDIVQEFECTGSSTNLIESISDGRYHWTIQTHQGQLFSTWMLPQSFMLDRTSPVFISGPEKAWYPLSDPNITVVYRDNTSGLDPGSVECRTGPVGGPYSEWYPARVEDSGNGMFNVTAELPAQEGNQTFWVRASDRAGNGPVHAGSFKVGIDGTPPTVSEITPEGWTTTSVNISLRCVDHGSGFSNDLFLSIVNDHSSNNISMGVEMLGSNLYRSVDPLILFEGDHTIRIFAEDRVGNIGSSDPITINVDGTSPYISSFYPADGAIIADPLPIPFIRISDDLSGPKEMDYHLEGPSGIFNMRYGEVEDAVDIDIGQELSEGTYTWWITGMDVAGNTIYLGPYTFIVDLASPECTIVDVDIENNSVLISYLDTVTGPDELDIRCEIPVEDGFEHSWSGSVDGMSGGPSSSLMVALPDHINSAVSYVSARATDLAGNAGPWSKRLRVDLENDDPRVNVETPIALKPEDPLEMIITDPRGIDPDTLKLEMIRGTGSPVTMGPSYREVLMNVTPIEGSDLYVPSMVRAVFTIPLSEGILDIKVLFKDPFPYPADRTSESREVIIDPLPPIISMDLEPFYSEVPVRIPLRYHDEHSGILSVEVSIDGGPFSLIGTPGSPFLTKMPDKDPLLSINMTYGPVTLIKVGVTDLAGHRSQVEGITRATRSPTASISGGNNGSVIAGESFRLSASGEDPDGDNITFGWFLDGVAAGTGDSIDLVLEKGSHQITLNCTDGDLFFEDQMVILAEEPEDKEEDNKGSLIPFIIFIILVLIAVGIGAFVFIWKRKEGNVEDDDDEMDWDDEESYDDNVLIGKDSSREGGSGIKCDICLRPLRSSSRKVKCRCGANFHRACAAKEGECPECGREIMIRTDD